MIEPDPAIDAAIDAAIAAYVAHQQAFIAGSEVQTAGAMSRAAWTHLCAVVAPLSGEDREVLLWYAHVARQRAGEVATHPERFYRPISL